MRAVVWRSLALLIVCLLPLAATASADLSGAPFASAAVVPRAEGLASDPLPGGLLDALLSASSEPFEPAGGAFRARAGGLSFTLDAGGLTASTGGLTWGLTLTGLGRGERLRPVAQAVLAQAGGRLEYRRGALTEWYRDTALGLEQGFTLLRRPRGRGELALELRLGGGLAGVVDADGRGISFALADGGLLRYAHLRAWDARGAALPARLEVAGDRLALRVDDRGAAYPLTIDPLVFIEVQKVYASGEPQDHFGISLALDGDRALVGTPGYDYSGITDRGSAYIFLRTGTTWRPDGDLGIWGEETSTGFGCAVALQGDTAMVGAYAQDAGGNADRGSVAVFARQGSAWTEQATLTAADGAAGDGFGYALALSGATVVIGAPYAAAAGSPGLGSAYVFTRTGSTWSQQAKLWAADGALSDTFGCAVALSGATALVGARGADLDGAPDAGSAYVFVGSGSSWEQQAKLTAQSVAAGDSFGASVALDGDTALVGAHLADSGGAVDQGTATVFVRDAGLWTRQATLTPGAAAAGAGFGAALALAGDTAVVGAPLEVGSIAQQGAAYVFGRSGASWSQQARLLSAEPAPLDHFGAAVALSGERVLVGAPLADIGAHADQGAASVFVRAGAGWQLEQQLTHWDAGPLIVGFGTAVALDGDTALVASYWDYDSTLDIMPGSAWVFVRANGEWRLQQHLRDLDGGFNMNLDNAVALDGDTAIVGALLDDVEANNGQGSAVVYTRSAGIWNVQQRLVAQGGVAHQSFGTAVALDGDTALVGAPAVEQSDVSIPGSAYVFTRNGTSWSQTAHITPTAGADGDFFGLALALEGDTVLVGAPGTWYTPTLGSAYVFTRSGATWVEQAQLTGAGGAPRGDFGFAVQLQGDTALVSAPGERVGANAGQGSVHVFTRSAGAWTERQTLVAPDGAAGDGFGIGLALQGGIAVVGSLADIGANADQGAAYVLVSDGAGWRLARKLTASDGVAHAQFGRALALDGATLLVGAPDDTFVVPDYRGSLYVYDLRQGMLLPLLVAGAE